MSKAPSHLVDFDPGRRPLVIVLLLVLWLMTVGNLTLWQSLWELPGVSGWRGLGFSLGFGLMLGAVTVALCSLFAWPRLLKAFATLLLVAAAVGTYFMQAYGVVLDPSMLRNALATDAREVRDLLNLRMLLALGLVAGLPAWWLWRQKLDLLPPLRQGMRNLGVFCVALLVTLVSGFVIYKDFVSLMRNHKEVRYRINPLNSLYSASVALAGSNAARNLPLRAVGEDARLGASYAAQSRPPLVILVVGETARAANFQLGGYARETNPRLAALQAKGEVSYFRDVWSCGTNTHDSLPCMFSSLGKEVFQSTKQPHENLLDVLQRAGLAVLWIDNQSGCKGICVRAANAETRALADPVWCQGDECFDEIMLHGLDDRIAALDAAQRANGVVIVMHQMGSHGPAYYKRVPLAHKHFQPECASNALQDCPREHVVNAYDNTLRYTDHFLAESIEWLRARSRAHDTALLYVSDHGESLGENNLYLHGLPYAIAPDVQKHVPMLTWLSPTMEQRLRVDRGCLADVTASRLTHDNLFHSMLGLLDVDTSARNPALNFWQRCQR